MALGYAPYILRSLKKLAGENYPGTKITAAGMLAMLLENSDIANAKITDDAGHQRSVQVKYKVRQNPSLVSESLNCDIDYVPAYKEAAMTAPRSAKIGFHVSMDLMSRYEDEATNGVKIGNRGITVEQEIVDSIQHTANAIIGKIDQRLLSDTVFGNNSTFGSGLRTLNMNKSQTTMDLDTGYARLLNDMFLNEVSGTLNIVGSGLFNALELQKAINGYMNAAQNGIDLSKFNGYKFYPDLYSPTSSGWNQANQIGVFAKGDIHFVDFQRYVGFQSKRLGVSEFFQIMLMVNAGSGIEVPMIFDVQIKEIDCDTALLNHYGETVTYSRGYAVILSKTYGLFQTPTDAFDGADRLTGVNGAFRYLVSNTCDTCD